MLIPANSANPQGALPADGLRLPARDRADDHRVGAVHVAGAGGAGPHRHTTRPRRAAGTRPTCEATAASDVPVARRRAARAGPRSAATSPPTRNARSGTTIFIPLTESVAVPPGPGEGPRPADGHRGRRRPAASRRSGPISSWPSASGASPTGCWRRARIYLALAFIVPLILVVYTSLQSGGLLSGGYHFTWAFDNYAEAFSASTGTFYRESLVYSGLATLVLHPARLPDGVLDRVLRRQVEGDPVLPDPRAVLRVVRDPHGAVEVHPRRRRRALRAAEERSGSCPDDFRVLRDAGRGGRRHHVQLPAVHGAAALRGARAHRQAARRGGQGPVRLEVRGVPQGRAAAVVPGLVRGAGPDVRAGHRRLRELERARSNRAPR